MTAITPKEWVENWKRLSPVLDEIKASELRLLDEDEAYRKEAIRNLMSMCEWCIDHSEPRLTSGFAEQQRLFAKLRNK
ncbi:MAG: hypothetical protein LBP59_06005 [Planctomycetaceae bacterium]|jgi:hypothetical protein|nr:hypothetical protein [Planctomycetaceae bacterium]